MPMYTYRCDACGATEEHLHPAGDRLEVTCLECDSLGMVWQFPCPNLVTDSTFNRGSDDGFGSDDRSRKIARKKAKAAGVNIAGKRFMHELVPLGAEPFDPNGTWIDGRGDIKRRCKEKGWSSEGSVKVKPIVLDKPGPLENGYQVNDRIVQEQVNDLVERDHGGKVSKKKRQDMVEHHRERMSGIQI